MLPYAVQQVLAVLILVAIYVAGFLSGRKASALRRRDK